MNAIPSTRHYCRNPRCRSKLAKPVENARSAFCSRGCHTQFYRKRCMACEQPMERKVEHQRLCGRRKCKADFAALQAHGVLGRYWRDQNCISDARNPIKPGLKAPVRHNRTAVPASETHPVHPGLTADQYAAVCRDVERGRISRESFHEWKAGIPSIAPRVVEPPLIGPHDAPLNLIGGYRFPNTKTLAEVLPADVAEVA